MAIGSNRTDPALDEQLYGPPIPGAASLADTPWSWVPPHWNDAGGGGGTQHVGPGDAAAPGSELPAAAPPPVTPTPVDAGPGAGADAPPSPSPAPQQPGIGIPAAAFDAAASSPPLPPAGPLGVPSAFPAPPPTAAEAGPVGPVPSDVPALQHLPFGLGGSPPIAPESLDTTAAASGGLGSVPEQWAADPLHAPAPVAQDWAQNATPLDVLDQKRKLDEARETKRVLDQSRADEENLRQVRADITARQKADAATQAKSDQIVADAIKLSQAKVDPDRWMSTRSGGQKLAALIAVIAGGLYQGRTGGARNIGMDMIQQHIDRDIEAQKQDIESGRYALGVRQNQVAQEFARTGNLYEAAEKVRLATYQAAINKMMTEQQNFDPRGTGWLNYAAAIQDMRGRSAQAGEVMRKTIFEEQYKTEQLLQVAQKQADDRWKARQDVALGWAKEGREGATAKTKDRVFSVDELRALMPPGTPLPPIGMTQKDLGEWLGNAKKGQEASLGQREYGIGDSRPVRDQDGNIVGTEFKPLVNKDGQPFQAPSPDSAKTLRDQKAGVDVTNELIDRMIAGIKKYGGSSEFLKSPEWTTMTANKESLLFALHQAYGVTGFRPGVLEQMEKALGGQDPTAYTFIKGSAIPGMEAAKKAISTHFNSNLRAAGYSGPEYSSPDNKSSEELPKLADRTLAESQPGALDQVGQGLRTSLGNLITPAAPTPNAGVGLDSGPAAGPTGLSVRDTASVQEMVRKYKAGTPATKERVLTELTSAMGADRPSLRAGILGLVDGESPELYDALAKTLPPAEWQQLQRAKEATAAAAAQLSQPIVPIEFVRGGAARQE